MIEEFSKEEYKKSCFVEEQFKFDEKIKDERFGTINILQNRYNQSEKLMQKEIKSKKLYDCEKDIFQVRERMRLNHQSLLKMIDYSIKEIPRKHKKSYYIVSGYYEFIKDNLKIELEKRKRNKINFTGQELLSLIEDLLEVMTFLQKNERIHGDIRPKYISLCPRAKLMDRLGDPRPPNQVQLSNLKKNKSLYMSPCLFHVFMHKEKKLRHNPYKSDVFSLGMVILECGILDSVQNVYDRDKKEIDTEKLMELLNRFMEIYQDCFLVKEAILWFIDLNGKDRKDPKRLLKKFNEYKINNFDVRNEGGNFEIVPQIKDEELGEEVVEGVRRREKTISDEDILGVDKVIEEENNLVEKNYDFNFTQKDIDINQKNNLGFFTPQDIVNNNDKNISENVQFNESEVILEKKMNNDEDNPEYIDNNFKKEDNIKEFVDENLVEYMKTNLYQKNLNSNPLSNINEELTDPVKSKASRYNINQEKFEEENLMENQNERKFNEQSSLIDNNQNDELEEENLMDENHQQFEEENLMEENHQQFEEENLMDENQEEYEEQNLSNQHHQEYKEENISNKLQQDYEEENISNNQEGSLVDQQEQEEYEEQNLSNQDQQEFEEENTSNENQQESEEEEYQTNNQEGSLEDQEEQEEYEEEEYGDLPEGLFVDEDGELQIHEDYTKYTDEDGREYIVKKSDIEGFEEGQEIYNDDSGKEVNRNESEENVSEVSVVDSNDNERDSEFRAGDSGDSGDEGNNGNVVYENNGNLVEENDDNYIEDINDNFEDENNNDFKEENDNNFEEIRENFADKNIENFVSENNVNFVKEENVNFVEQIQDNFGEKNQIDDQNKSLTEVSVIDSNEEDYDYKESINLNEEEIVNKDNDQDVENKSLSEVSLIGSNEPNFNYGYKEVNSGNENMKGFKNQNTNLYGKDYNYNNEEENISDDDKNPELSHESIDYEFHQKNKKRIELDKKMKDEEKKPKQEILSKNSSFNRKRIDIEFSEGNRNENNCYYEVEDTETQTVTELELSSGSDNKKNEIIINSNILSNFDPSKMNLKKKNKVVNVSEIIGENIQTNLVEEKIEENFKIDENDNLDNKIDNLDKLVKIDIKVKNPVEFENENKILNKMSSNNNIDVSEEILNYKNEPNLVVNNLAENFKNEPLLNLENKNFIEKINNQKNLNKEHQVKVEVNINSSFGQKNIMANTNINIAQNINNNSKLENPNLNNIVKTQNLNIKKTVTVNSSEVTPEIPKNESKVDIKTMNAYNKVKWNSNNMVMDFINRNQLKNLNNPVDIKNNLATEDQNKEVYNPVIVQENKVITTAIKNREVYNPVIVQENKVIITEIKNRELYNPVMVKENNTIITEIKNRDVNNPVSIQENNTIITENKNRGVNNPVSIQENNTIITENKNRDVNNLIVVQENKRFSKEIKNRDVNNPVSVQENNTIITEIKNRVVNNPVVVQENERFSKEIKNRDVNNSVIGRNLIITETKNEEFNNPVIVHKTITTGIKNRVVNNPVTTQENQLITSETKNTVENNLNKPVIQRNVSITQNQNVREINDQAFQRNLICVENQNVRGINNLAPRRNFITPETQNINVRQLNISVPQKNMIITTNSENQNRETNNQTYPNMDKKNVIVQNRNIINVNENTLNNSENRRSIKQTNNPHKNIINNQNKINIPSNTMVNVYVGKNSSQKFDNNYNKPSLYNKSALQNQLDKNTYKNFKTESNSTVIENNKVLSNNNYTNKNLINEQLIKDYNKMKFDSNNTVNDFINKNLVKNQHVKVNLKNTNEDFGINKINESLLIKNEDKSILNKNNKKVEIKLNKTYAKMEKISEEEEANFKNSKKDYKIERTFSDEQKLNILCSDIPVLKKHQLNKSQVKPKKKYYSDRIFNRQEEKFDIKNVETINEERSIISKNFTTIPKKGIINSKFEKNNKIPKSNVSTFSYRDNYKPRNSSPLKIHNKGLTFRIFSKTNNKDHFFSNNSKIKSRVSQTMDRRVMQSRFKNKPEPRYSNISDSSSHINEKEKNIYLFRDSNNSGVLRRTTEDSIGLQTPRTPTIIYKKHNEYKFNTNKKNDLDNLNKSVKSRSSKIVIKSNNPFSSEKEILLNSNLIRKNSSVYYSKREIPETNSNLNKNYDVKKNYIAKNETNIYYKKTEEKDDIKNKNIVLYKNYQNDNQNKETSLNRYGYKVKKTQARSTRFILSNEKKKITSQKNFEGKRISSLNSNLSINKDNRNVIKNREVNISISNKIITKNPRVVNKEEKKVVRIKI